MTLSFKIEDPASFVRDLIVSSRDFESNYGKPPIGFILGPMEYLKLQIYVANNLHYYDDRINGNVSKLIGLPIRIKPTPGFDLEISYNMVSYFAWKETKK